MTLTELGSVLYLILDYGIKIYAVGTIPENRRPSSSQAWLLIILLLPAVGLPLYWLIGSPYVRGRRNKIQAEANQLLDDGLQEYPTVPAGAHPSPELSSILHMNRRLTGLPCVTGANEGLFGETPELYRVMAEAVRRAQSYVHVEFYIMSWDHGTEEFFTALADAADRGVRVRLLLDHLGSRKYPGWKAFQHRLTASGIDWQLMMPIDLLRRRVRRPDLRNHRKLLIVDGTDGFMGSHNVIHPSYGSSRNVRIGREWKDLTIRVSGDIVLQLQSVFAVDWYTETGHRLDPARYFVDQPDLIPGGTANALQIVPSGPGFATEPNLRLFTSLVAMATKRVSITSPYFVPDESLLSALTTAAYRGVRVDLFVGEQADQFIVGHAQRSYYRALLEAGIHIHLYPAPTVLHAKYLTIDDMVGAIGSSNMDYRSFVLDYEVTMLGFGGDLVESLQAVDAEYLAISRELTLTDWLAEPWHRRYVDNVCRLASALM